MTPKTYRLPRRLVVAQLREVKGYLGLLVDAWDERQTVVEHTGTSRYGWRKRTDAEKVENDPQAWTRLSEWARHLAKILTKLADFADEQRIEAEKRSQS